MEILWTLIALGFVVVLFLMYCNRTKKSTMRYAPATLRSTNEAEEHVWLKVYDGTTTHILRLTLGEFSQGVMAANANRVDSPFVGDE